VRVNDAAVIDRERFGTCFSLAQAMSGSPPRSCGVAHHSAIVSRRGIYRARLAAVAGRGNGAAKARRDNA
jgi:hypothetical protein